MGDPRSRATGIRRWLSVALSTGVLAYLGVAGSTLRIALADSQPEGPASPAERSAETPDRPGEACQVTVIGILVIPAEAGGAVDPKLVDIQSQLLKLIPGHGFKLTDVRRGRLSAGQTVRCDLGKGKTARVTLIDPLDQDGKVKLRCDLSQGDTRLFATEVATPLNQLFFCERKLADGTRLLIGVGAR